MSSAFWLVARRQSGFAMLADPRTVVHRAGDVVNPDSYSRVSALGVRLLGAQFFSTFVHSFPFPLSLSPSVWSPGLCSSPREKVSKVLTEFIARNSTFYRPKLALIGQLHIT